MLVLILRPCLDFVAVDFNFLYLKRGRIKRKNLMVQLMKSGNLSLEPDMASLRDKAPVKLEIEDSLEEEHAPFSKRSKTATTFSPVCGIGFSFASLRRNDGEEIFFFFF